MTEKIKIVVIDDVASCRNFLIDVLEDRGYEVASFGNAEEFICQCSATEHCPVNTPCADLLLTDNQMPRLTGLEMIEAQLAKGCKLQTGQRAIMSGSWTGEELDRAQSFGCQTFEKPCLEGLRTWLDKFELDR